MVGAVIAMIKLLTDSYSSNKPLLYMFMWLWSLMLNVCRSFLQVYAKADETARFIRRFFMRESVNQLSAVIRPVDAAADSLEEEAQKERWFFRRLENLKSKLGLHYLFALDNSYIS